MPQAILYLKATGLVATLQVPVKAHQSEVDYLEVGGKLFPVIRRHRSAKQQRQDPCPQKSRGIGGPLFVNRRLTGSRDSSSPKRTASTRGFMYGGQKQSLKLPTARSVEKVPRTDEFVILSDDEESVEEQPAQSSEWPEAEAARVFKVAESHAKKSSTHTRPSLEDLKGSLNLRQSQS